MYKVTLILLMSAYFSINALAQYASIHNCDVAFEGVDPNLDEYLVEMGKEKLFYFTPSYLERLLTEFPLVEAEGNLHRTSGYVFFAMNLKVNSARAKKDYGSIKKGSMLKFFLMDGNSFYSFNLTNYKPKINEDRTATLYIASCSFDKDEIKMLENSFIDKIGVTWSNGYEEYEIFNPDFFINQMQCLESK